MNKIVKDNEIKGVKQEKTTINWRRTGEQTQKTKDQRSTNNKKHEVPPTSFGQREMIPNETTAIWVGANRALTLLDINIKPTTPTTQQHVAKTAHNQMMAKDSDEVVGLNARRTQDC